MSNIPEKEWKSALTSILEELDASQYSKMLECLDQIPKSLKTSRSKQKMPQRVIEYYGVGGSISAINDAMDQIPRRDDVVQKLLKPFVEKHEKEIKGNKRKRDPEEEEERPAADQQKSCQPDKERNSRPWRKTICDLNSSGQLLGTEGIIGKVVEKSGLRTYQTKDNAEKFFFYLAVADDTDSVKVMVYGKKFYKEIQEEKFYFFRKLVIDERAVKVTALSKVSQTRSVEVPEELEMKARELIYPKIPVCSIANAKLSADGTNVSVEGTVTEIDPVEQVKVKDKRKTTKGLNFQLKDDTDSIRICMWGENTNQCQGLSAGDVIKVTNVKTKKYFETVSLNSTGFTRIHKVQSVGIQNVRIEFIGIKKATKEETHLEAELNQQVHTFVVASRLLAEAFGIQLDRNFRETLLDKMKIKLSADAVIEGSKIKKITAA